MNIEKPDYCQLISSHIKLGRDNICLLYKISINIRNAKIHNIKNLHNIAL